MKLKDAREAYYEYTGKLSDVNRQLCFAGIAVIWIFAVKEDSGGVTISSQLLLPLGCFVLGLTFDLLQYTVQSVSWGVFHRSKENSGISEEDEIGAPAWINWAPDWLMCLKVLFTLLGYIALLVYFLDLAGEGVPSNTVDAVV